MDHDGRMGVCLDYTVNVHPLVQLAEPGDMGVASPKQKRYAMRTVHSFYVFGIKSQLLKYLYLHVRPPS